MTNAARRSSTKGYSSEVKAIIAASPSKVTARRAKALEALIAHNRKSGVWQKLDVLWFTVGAESEGNLAINLKTPGSYTLTKVGTTVHDPQFGVKGDGSTGYYDTGWIPGTHGVNYQTDSCHVGSWEFSNVANTSDPAMSVIGTGRIALIPRTGSSGISTTINANTTTGTTGGSSTDSSGHTCVSRTGTACETYKDGGLSSVWSHTAPSSTAVTARSLYLLARNNAGTADQFSSRFLGVWHAGGYLTPAENASLYASIAAYFAKLRAVTSTASSVSYGGIPVGSNTAGVGSSASPWLTVDQANASSVANGSILLNGNPAAPTVYTHGTLLSITNKSIGSTSGNPLGATLRATTTTAEVLNVNPGNTGVANIGAITVDGNSVNPQCVEVSNTPTALFDVNLTGTKITGATLYGVWTSGLASYGKITLNDCTITLGSLRSAIQHYMSAGASLTIRGGTHTVTSAVLGTVSSWVEAYTLVAGTSLTVVASTVSVTMSAALAGASVQLLTAANIANVSMTGGTYTLDGSAAAKGVYGINLNTTNDVNAQDMGGFLLADGTLNIRAHPGGSSRGVTIGREGTLDANVENTLLLGGTIRDYTVNGLDADTQTSAFHAYLFASHTDVHVDNCAANKCYLGFGIKEGKPFIDGGSVYDFTAYGVIYKGSRPGAITDGVRTTSIAGNNGTRHIDGHANVTTGNNCEGTIHRNCHHVNDGATGVIFVDVDAGQDITLTGNNYFNRSGTLDALPFRYHGTSYATFAAYQAAVEPTATNVDPDL